MCYLQPQIKLDIKLNMTFENVLRHCLVFQLKQNVYFACIIILF